MFIRIKTTLFSSVKVAAILRCVYNSDEINLLKSSVFKLHSKCLKMAAQRNHSSTSCPGFKSHPEIFKKVILIRVSLRFCYVRELLLRLNSCSAQQRAKSLFRSWPELVLEKYSELEILTLWRTCMRGSEILNQCLRKLSKCRLSQLTKALASLNERKYFTISRRVYKDRGSYDQIILTSPSNGSNAAILDRH